MPVPSLADVQSLAARCVDMADPQLDADFEAKFGQAPTVFAALPAEAQQAHLHLLNIGIIESGKVTKAADGSRSPAASHREIPNRVIQAIAFEASQLKEAARALDGVRRARGVGHILSLELADRTGSIKKSFDVLSEVHGLAVVNEVEDRFLELIAQHRIPDFKEFGFPSSDIPTWSLGEGMGEGIQIAAEPQVVYGQGNVQDASHAQLFTCTWPCQFEGAKFTTMTRIVVDGAQPAVVAAQKWMHGQFVDFSNPDEFSYLQANVVELHKAQNDPIPWGLSRIDQAPEWSLTSKVPERYESLSLSALDRLVNEGVLVEIPEGGLLGNGWLMADGYTKDLFMGATYMSQIGGDETPYATYDFTIAETEDGRWTPIHGSTKMTPVDTPEQAAFCLMKFWHEIPENMKVRYNYVTHSDDNDSPSLGM